MSRVHSVFWVPLIKTTIIKYENEETNKSLPLVLQAADYESLDSEASRSWIVRIINTGDQRFRAGEVKLGELSLLASPVPGHSFLGLQKPVVAFMICV